MKLLLSPLYAALCKYAPFLKLMQDYGQYIEHLLVKQREALYGLITELMCGKHDFSNVFQFFPVVGVDGKQRIAYLNLITDLTVDEKTHGMVDGIGLTGPPGAKVHGSLPHAPRLDLR
jgi:hypothetical protein